MDPKLRQYLQQQILEQTYAQPPVGQPVIEPPVQSTRQKVAKAFSNFDKQAKYYMGPHLSEAVEKITPARYLHQAQDVIEYQKDAGQAIADVREGKPLSAAKNAGYAALDALSMSEATQAAKELALLIPAIMGRKSKYYTEQFGRSLDEGLELAERMEKAGASHNQIWREAGLDRATDNIWRYEIPDAQVDITSNPQMFQWMEMAPDVQVPSLGIYGGRHVRAGMPPYVEEIYNNPYLYDEKLPFAKTMYGSEHDVRYIPVGMDLIEVPGGLGTGNYNNAEDVISLKVPFKQFDLGFDDKDMIEQSLKDRNTEASQLLAHELQHAIQKRFEKYGVHGGGNPTISQALSTTGYGEVIDPVRRKAQELKDKLGAYSAAKMKNIPPVPLSAEETIKINKELDDVNKKLGDYETYLRLSGETEAWNVGKNRYKMTPEQRKAFSPTRTADFPKEEQIYSPWDLPDKLMRMLAQGKKK